MTYLARARRMFEGMTRGKWVTCNITTATKGSRRDIGIKSDQFEGAISELVAGNANLENCEGIVLLANCRDEILEVVEAAETHDCNMGCKICSALEKLRARIGQETSTRAKVEGT